MLYKFLAFADDGFGNMVRLTFEQYRIAHMFAYSFSSEE